MTFIKAELDILRKALKTFDAPLWGENGNDVDALQARIIEELNKAVA